MNQQQRAVLVIDDADFIRHGLRCYLEDIGYLVLEAENGRQGLAVFEQERPDIVLVDLRMPEMDGMEVLSRLSSSHPDIPLIVISGTGLIEDAVNALRNGAWDYLTKPVEDLSVLRDVVEKTLARAHNVKKNRRYQKQLEDEVAKRTAELERTYRALVESEEKFVKIFQFSPDPILISNFQTEETLNVNKAFVDLTGYEKDEVLGTVFADISIWGTGNQPADIKEKLQKTGECLNLETSIRTKDDRILNISLSARCVEFPDGPHVISIIRDKSEQKDLESQLIQAQKMESIGRLAGGVAHDFNNLLIPVLGYAEMILSDMDKTHEHHDYIQDIYNAADKARMLIRQLLAFSRKQILEVKPVSLIEVIGGFKQILRRTIRESIALKYEIEKDLSIIKGDSAQIEQILMNLCVNAQDAMPDGGTLTIAAENAVIDELFISLHPGARPGAYVVLIISDTGCGMDEATRLNIFEPFFTTKEDGKGTGLGLSTVYGIVKQHKGFVTVESDPGKGSVFKAFFPQATADETAIAASGDIPEKPKGKGESVLVVEDDFAVRELIKNILTKYDYRVIAVDNPSECAALVAGNDSPVDLLLTDVVMPSMNGSQLYEALHEILPHLKVIYMSGYEDSEVAQHGVPDSGAAFLKKPFSISGLLQKIYSVMGQSPIN
ncbi:MAG: response regulator [Thermodesulfobacteriota bacterium]|nr:response regulator [Thermodesulfobacteriota bacterium]